MAQSAHILIVEDDVISRTLIATLLKQDGYTILTASSGEEALAAVAGDAPDLILLDILMAGMDGYQVAARLKADPATENIPIIMITALDDREAMYHGLTAGAQDFLTKPVDRAELRMRVVNMLRMKQYSDFIANHNRSLEQDVRERTAHLHDREARIRAILDSVDEAIITMSEQGDIETFNPAAETIFGHASAEMIGRHVSLLIPDLEGIEQEGAQMLSRRENEARILGGGAETVGVRKDGARFPLEIKTKNIDTEFARLFIVSARDISARKGFEARLQYQATHDALTGLANRTLLYEKLRQTIADAASRAEPVWVLFLDIDRFKFVNDSRGHKIGDQLLKMIAARLQSTLYATDTAARFDGSEFVLILPGRTEDAGPDSIRNAVQHVMTAVADPFRIDDYDFFLTCSIGVAGYPEHAVDAEILVERADMAMYRAKEIGRNNFQFYSNEMNAAFMERVTLESALRVAIPNSELDLVYQPQVDLQSGRIVGMEALLQWQHPELGLIPPERFLPIAEESGVIVTLGEWLLRRVCQDIRLWMEAGCKVPRVAIDLSPSQFRDPLLLHKVQSISSETGVDPRMLSFEVKEGVLMSDSESIADALRHFKQLGITLTLDDFGTGYSSLSYLKQFPLDTVKIEESFIKNITTDTNDVAISNAIISMAHSLGIRVIAEGVETEAQCDFLRWSMCDEIQGGFFSQPLDTTAIAALLQEDRRLPSHLLRFSKPSRTLLLVDDEPNILSSLKRLLRRSGCEILVATSAEEGLELLARQQVDVILSDQRMPSMNGTEFLRIAKERVPDTVRIVLSGYTELESVTSAINEGAVYRFLTKPWDDKLLARHIEEAFQYKEKEDENRRLNLQVRTANQELATANRQLEELLVQRMPSAPAGMQPADDGAADARQADACAPGGMQPWRNVAMGSCADTNNTFNQLSRSNK
jgi:diguanylate cyclase (GGDEF)-like protein/PAS domain S-box-containing protein